MPTRLNRLFDLPMQEWWLDETNIGASLVAVVRRRLPQGDDRRPACASEPYLMSRGNPYGTDSFPAHERRTRVLLSLTYGGALADVVRLARPRGRRRRRLPRGAKAAKSA